MEGRSTQTRSTVVYRASHARQVYGTRYALAVSTSSFTPPTWQLANTRDVALWDRDILVQRLARLGAERRAATPTRYSRAYGGSLLKAELRRGVPAMLKLGLFVAAGLLAVLGLLAVAVAGSTSERSR